MGTRADFYIGRAKAPDDTESAVWLGSTAFDGDPASIKLDWSACVTENGYRGQVARMLENDHSASIAGRHGWPWPWPWKNSQTTDFAYAFAMGTVWVSCLGRGWDQVSYWLEHGDPDPDGVRPQNTPFPDMTRLQEATLGVRSGVMVIAVDQTTGQIGVIDPKDLP